MTEPEPDSLRISLDKIERIEVDGEPHFRAFFRVFEFPNVFLWPVTIREVRTYAEAEVEAWKTFDGMRKRVAESASGNRPV
ncbi:hypothetical protein [Methylobacterium trifolii]|uniref:Uncharacterized protein n=1 Tax=Methylobacterium trifolii TaxID=1003092 RepID=A0ABQ4TW86_9HYPH|nr:hypothetical protein [Methylobacterium trifolii]GJE59087.1 hypothetical protein MPOCJGCO_1174 [Methylobacterium trifolii]